MKNALLLLTLTILITSCESKKDREVEYLITGHLYQDCHRVPRANVPLSIHRSEPFRIMATATTDSTGRFAFFCKGKAGADGLTIAHNGGVGGGEYLRWIPSGKNLDVDVFTQDYSYVEVGLNINGPYSTTDTLYYWIQGTSPKILLGPFSSGIIDNISFNMQGNHGQQEKHYFVWGLGKKDFTQAATSIHSHNPRYQVTEFEAGICSSTEMVINLDK